MDITRRKFFGKLVVLAGVVTLGPFIVSKVKAKPQATWRPVNQVARDALKTGEVQIGHISRAEILNQDNPILKNAVWKEANSIGFQTRRVTLPRLYGVSNGRGRCE